MALINKISATVLLLLSCSYGLAAQEISAVDSARNSVNELLATVQELRPYYDTDKERYFSGIEDRLTSFVDFDAVATGVMARYSENATPEQISRFGNKLKVTLTRFYGAALAGYDGQELVFLPARDSSEDSSRTATVRMQITANNTKVELQYALFLNDSDVWKLRNLYLGGINLRRQYYTQFSALMNRYGNDIDQVIDNWQ